MTSEQNSPVPAIEFDTSIVTLVYKDEDGKEYEQPLNDVFYSGTLIDPETGDDLELVRAYISLMAAHYLGDRAKNYPSLPLPAPGAIG